MLISANDPIGMYLDAYDEEGSLIGRLTSIVREGGKSEWVGLQAGTSDRQIKNVPISKLVLRANNLDHLVQMFRECGIIIEFGNMN